MTKWFLNVAQEKYLSFVKIELLSVLNLLFFYVL
jgi:hypothetical protein